MKFPQRKSRPIKETQMVSLADIAFLIIFFFMLASNFMRDRTVVNLPALPQSSRTESSIVISIDANGRTTLDGEEVSGREALENQLRLKLEGKTKPEDCQVRVRCDRNARHKNIQPVYEAISAAGGVISIMHEVRK